MDLPLDLGARYLAEQRARGSRLLFGASDFPVDTAEHALFVCGKWGMAREALGQAVGAELTPDTMVPLMLQSERFWTLIESFITLVMMARELDGRRE